jgi:hypothetical protein
MAVPPKRGKRVSPQTLIGEGGVSMISRRVNEMGFLYHDRRVDHGIDGEIELVADGSALNRVIMVQSKASNRSHTFETADSFQWTPKPEDLDYWLGGNAPVIVVLSRPVEDLAWWVDIRAEFSDPRRRAERTVTVNKHTQVFDKSAAPAMLRIGVPRDSGLFLPPPPKKELLTSNLLPVETFPDHIFVAPAVVDDYRTAWEILRDTPGEAAAWILHDKMVISFGDLRSQPLRRLCDGGVERHDTVEWADSDDDDRLHRFGDLLRRTLANDRRRDVHWHQDRHHLHFRATHNLAPRVVGRGNGRRGRTVFGPHYSKAEPERVSYYHHAAVNPRFRRIGGQWLCQLGVDYCFTHDGWKESSFADGLLAGIKRLERHPAVLGWTRMWEGYLQGDLLTARSLLTFGKLLTFEVDRGIDDDWWGPAPGTGVDDDSSDDRTDAGADAALHRAGVDQDDLLSLLNEMTEAATAPARPTPRSPRRVTKRVPRPRGRDSRSSD